MQLKSIVCPVSEKKINNSISRVTTFLVSIFIVLFIYSKAPVYMIVVAVDAFLRSFGVQTLSPFKWLASKLVSLTGLSGKQIDMAPKIFASRLGFLFAFTSAVLFYLQLPTASLTVAIILLACTVLDSVCNFCIGCLVYHYLVLPLYKTKLK